jgi:hypothetical protein
MMLPASVLVLVLATERVRSGMADGFRLVISLEIGDLAGWAIGNWKLVGTAGPVAAGGKCIIHHLCIYLCKYVNT